MSNNNYKTMMEDTVPVIGIDDLTCEGQQIVKSIFAYKNPAVVKRYSEDAKVSIDEAQRTFDGLKQYLAACVFTGGKRTPAKIIDECWHTFLLHLRDYQVFCERYLRGLVYHDPAIDNSGFDYYPKTRAAALALYGELDELIWPSDHSMYARCISTKAPEPSRFLDMLTPEAKKRIQEEQKSVLVTA